MVNQILLHISNTPLELIEYCQKKGIAVEAYSPIAHGEILHQPEIASMAEKYGVSVPQLCIRYTLQLGAISLPKTGNPEHMKTNADVCFTSRSSHISAAFKNNLFCIISTSCVLNIYLFIYSVLADTKSDIIFRNLSNFLVF